MLQEFSNVIAYMDKTELLQAKELLEARLKNLEDRDRLVKLLMGN